MMIRDPTAYNPPWFAHPNPTATIYSPTPRSPLSVMTPVNANGDFSPISSPTNTTHESLLTALSRYLPSNQPNELQNGTVFDSDEFRMYDFKVRGCTRPDAHDWTDCPFAHPGEKARRRDPRRHSYSGTPCSDHRKGICRRGDSCEFAHGVFESWLHPTRYRTQPCKDGRGCTRRVCFFAHAPGQLRVGPGPDPLSELVASVRSMQLSRPVWDSVEFDVAGSPRSVVRPGFYSLDLEEERMERVESGREVRARMFEKLSKENPLGGPGRVLN